MEKRKRRTFTENNTQNKNKAEKSKILKIDNIQYQKWLEEKHMESLKFQTLENQEKIQKRLKR